MSARPPATRLADFAALKKALQRSAREAREAAEQTRRERAEQLRAEREHQLFALSVGPVVPLRPDGRRVPSPPRLPPVARQRALDDQAVLRASLSDEIDVESLLDTDDGLSYRRPGVAPEVVRRLRRGHWAIQREIDLHGLRRDEARDRLAAFVREASRAGLRCVRIVHGKGNGSPGRAPVLKEKVRAWLVQKNEVMAFVQARASEGGHGALVVLLGMAAAPTPAPSRERR